ncbi:MAG: helix-turn-helix transcriptional regulator [Pirellulaceae bacterium]
MEKPQRVFRTERISPEEAARLDEIRRQAQRDFPPSAAGPLPALTGIGAQVRAAREARNLSWYSLAELASIPDAATIRDVEYGRDVQLSHLEAIAAALNLSLELVEHR